MKTALCPKKILGTMLLLFIMMPSANAQIWKKLQKSAERTVERKLERKTEKETGKMMDSILDPSQKSSNKSSTNTSKNPSENSSDSESANSGTTKTSTESKSISDGLEFYSNYDFVPGDKVLFYDDFSQDFIGDFPSKWNTNGSGSIAKINNAEGNWFELKPSHSTFYIPDLEGLPEDYTIEFDLLTHGITDKTAAGAQLRIWISDTDQLKETTHNAIYTTIPLSHYGGNKMHSSNRFDNNKGAINSAVAANIVDEIHNQPHIAIAITKNRYRLWVNERKFIDIPRMVEKLNVLNYLKFNLIGVKDDVERVFISNLRVADGGEDLRRTLLSKGKISTNGILFNSGSAEIKPQSMGLILQISQVLKQDDSIKLHIVGHTDADGNSDNNLKLSKERAQAVKDALVNHYSISANRLETDGKGASVPVADNNSADGKAQNRRVEFIKI